MFTSPRIARPLYYVAASLLLAGSLTVAVISSHADDWEPLVLVLLLGALAVSGELFIVSFRAQEVNAAFVAIILGLSLLGTAPAVAFGLAAMIYSSATRRLGLLDWLTNLSTYAAFPVAGGLMLHALIGDVHDPANAHVIKSVEFGLVVFAVFMVTVTINFALIAIHSRVFWGRRIREQAEQLFVPVLPAELAAALLTAVAVLVYTNFGLVWSFGSVLALTIFQLLVVRLIQAENDAEKLRTKVFELASSQVGTIKAAIKFLDDRDPGSERHAATVAIYARDLAKEVDCSEEDQYLVHTAALAHDIGRLILRDDVLRSRGPLSEDDWREIRRHPIEGSAWVGHIHGFGPVADIILAHHERWDGSGYPDQLIGPEIPLLSRIIAICEAFDAMTGAHTYRERISAQEAFEELRAGVATQFDPELVDVFIDMRTSLGTQNLTIPDADFDAQLDLENRIRMLAEPGTTTSGRLAARLARLLAP